MWTDRFESHDERLDVPEETYDTGTGQQSKNDSISRWGRPEATGLSRATQPTRTCVGYSRARNSTNSGANKHVIDKKDKGPLGRRSLGHRPRIPGFQRWLERPDYLSIFEDVGSIQLDVGNIMIQRLGLTKSLNTTSMGCLPFPSTLPGTHSHHSTSCLGYPSYTTGSRSKRPRK